MFDFGNSVVVVVVSWLFFCFIFTFVFILGLYVLFNVFLFYFVSFKRLEGHLPSEITKHMPITIFLNFFLYTL